MDTLEPVLCRLEETIRHFVIMGWDIPTTHLN